MMKNILICYSPDFPPDHIMEQTMHHVLLVHELRYYHGDQSIQKLMANINNRFFIMSSFMHDKGSEFLNKIQGIKVWV